LKIKTALTIAFFAALAAGSRAWFSLAATLDAAGRGAAAEAGVMPAAWWESLIAIANQTGGWTAAVGVRSGLIFLAWFAGLGFAFVLTVHLARKLGRPWIARSATVLVAFAGTCVGVAGILAGVRAAMSEPREARLIAPVTLIEAAGKNGGRVFSNPSAVPEIGALAPRLLGSMPLKERAAMMGSPVRWREEDRKNPASTVIISGRVAEARPLIAHLLASPDWRLALVDNGGVLFFRGNGPDFSPPAPEMVCREISGPDRAFLMARTALNYHEADLKTDARTLMNQALDMAPDDARVVVCGASLAASQGRWERARFLSEKALRIDPDSGEAAYLNAVSLLETGLADRALKRAGELARKNPDSAAIHLLRARAAKAANDPTSEIESLGKLVEMQKESGGVPQPRLQIYLGQAWAVKGFPDQALRAYEAALEGDLTPGEAADVRAAIKTIKENRLPSRP
jgi:hypothetical protein